MSEQTTFAKGLARLQGGPFPLPAVTYIAVIGASLTCKSVASFAAAWRPGSQENPPVDNYDCAK